MTRHNPAAGTGPAILLTMLIVVCTLYASATQAAMPDLNGDGWHRWQIDAIADAPQWCCFSQRGSKVANGQCDLDGPQQGFQADERLGSGQTRMQVLAKLAAGQVTQLRTLSVQCPVSTRGEIIDHGTVNPLDSVDWLARLVDPRGVLSSEALAAISLHAGDAARERLLRTAMRNQSIDNRKDAVFWIGQVRAGELADELGAIMFDDPLPAMREHAAFSVSQSSLPGRVDALGRLGRSDGNPGVRGKAWFWLAQTGATDAGTRIAAGLAAEKNDQVRGEAIFALAQLPGERGVEALIDVLENRALTDEDRKRAVFWMAQSSSDRAMDYLAALLD